MLIFQIFSFCINNRAAAAAVSNNMRDPYTIRMERNWFIHELKAFEKHHFIFSFWSGSYPHVHMYTVSICNIRMLATIMCNHLIMNSERTYNMKLLYNGYFLIKIHSHWDTEDHQN